MLKKSWVVFWYILTAATAAGAVAVLLLRSYFIIAAAILYLVLIIWWTIYYYRLEYLFAHNTICINSGIFLKRKRVISLERILWTMRLKMPLCKGTALTALHTSGGVVVIFCDFSTDC